MEASKLAQKGLEMDDSIPQLHDLLGYVSMLLRQYNKAIASYDHAIELAPNNYPSHVNKGLTFYYMGCPEKAIPVLKTALRGNPKDADWVYQVLGLANEMIGSYEKAIEYFF